MSPWRRVGLVCAWALSVLCGLWALLRLSGLEPPWPLSALLAFTPWVVVPALVAVGLAVMLRARWAVAVAAAAALVLAGVTAPRALGSADRRDGVELRVMTVNLRVGGADAATIVRLVRDNRIDLLAVQEYTRGARD